MQLPLDPILRRRALHPGWGGARPGSGRKPKGRKALVSHAGRSRHVKGHPVHVTMRARADVPSLRSQTMMRALYGALQKANRDGFRIVHFSVQTNHVHLIVEATDAAALRSGAQGLSIRAARAINRATGGKRKGKVWADRHHRHALRTPREVRNALVYVLSNHRKHATGDTARLDGCSSAAWFDGWRRPPSPSVLAFREAVPRPTVPPKTWLAREGWKRHGLIDAREAPTSG